MKRGKLDYDAALQSAVPGAVERVPNGTGHHYDVPCGGCGKTLKSAFHSANRMPPHLIAKNLKTRGWQIGTSARKHRCPNAPHEAPIRPVPVILRETVEVVDIVAPPVAPAPSSSDAARAAKRAAMDWLGESFNVEKGAFAPGVNDETIGKETKLATKAVVKLREEFFGPLKVPPELATLQAELVALENERQKIGRETTANLATLAQNIEAATRRIEAVVSRNGWNL